jgi:hypothetical protein
MTVDAALVTCVVRKGMAGQLVDAAREEGARGAAVYYSRAYGGEAVLDTHVASDEDIVSLIVAKDQIARILSRMYLTGALATPRRPISVVPLGAAFGNREGSRAPKAS